MEDFNGQVAVITGGGSGIGEGIATVLARAGAHIVIADLVPERVKAATQRLQDATGAQVLGVVTDVSDLESVEALADAVYARFGAVNLLFNNAGTTSIGTSWETPIEDYRRVLEVNLFGCVHGIQAFLPKMLAAGQPGHIINTSSMAGVTPIPLKAPLCGFKIRHHRHIEIASARTQGSQGRYRRHRRLPGTDRHDDDRRYAGLL